MLSQVGADIVAIFILVMMLVNMSINKMVKIEHKEMIFKPTIIILIIVGLEIIGTLIDGKSGIYIRYTLLSMYALGYALVPWVIYLLIIKENFLLKKVKNFFLIAIIIYNLCSVLSIKTGWIFLLDNKNEHVRGEFFEIVIIFNCILFLVLAISFFKFVKKYDIRQKSSFYLIIISVAIGTVLDVCIQELLIMWCMISIGIFLFYLFLRELNLMYDYLTNLGNRTLMETYISSWEKSNEAAVVMLDMNNLKYINDTYGHAKGDEHIRKIAELIKENFEGMGEAFRYGGDEFCILVKKGTETQIKEVLRKLNNDFSRQEIAYGYALKQVEGSFSNCIKKADRNMYICKELQKQRVC